MRLTTHRIYLAERLQSARGLGWEMPELHMPSAAPDAPRTTRVLLLRLAMPMLRRLGFVHG